MSEQRVPSAAGAARVRRVAASAEDLRCLAYHDARTFPVLFDSAAHGALGRYTILAASPQGALWQDAGGVLHADGCLQHHGLEGEPTFLAALARAWCAHSAPAAPPLPDGAESLPFRGGWAVFLGYELAAEIEPRLRLPEPSPQAAPRAFALRVPAALVYDHAGQSCWIVAETASGAAEAARLDEIEARLRAVAGRAQALLAQLPPPGVALCAQEEPPLQFQQRVRRALAYIRAGDVYQVNLSRAWRASRGACPAAQTAALYERLRASNPAPFACLARFQQFSLLSSSPERLVQLQEQRVHTRPIAGTRPRSRRGGREHGERAALIASPKERAEHVMLIDLERNDLGRICRAGSVRVEEFMRLETYSHVHHLVSCVAGELSAGLGPVDVLRSVFPGGTITGCPKFRCMQIIAELESEARGAYTGSIGYLNHDGSMDFNILIRSLTVHDGLLEFRAGAGIVADSRWQRELQETRAKARGVLAALRAP